MSVIMYVGADQISNEISENEKFFADIVNSMTAHDCSIVIADFIEYSTLASDQFVLQLADAIKTDRAKKKE